MNYLKKLLADSQGNPSSGRAMAILVVLTGIVYLFVKSDWQGAVAIIGLGLTAKTVAGSLE